MNNTLVVGDSHSDSLTPFSHIFNNFNIMTYHGTTLYGLLKKKEDILNQIKSNTYNQLIFVNGYVDINGALLYVKYNGDTQSIYKTLTKSIQNIMILCKECKKIKPNIKIFICNHIFNAYYDNPDILLYKYIIAVIITYMNQETPIHAKKIYKKFNSIKISKTTNYKKYMKQYKFFINKYNINVNIIKTLIGEQRTYIPFFEKLLESNCKKNNIILINLNHCLKTITDSGHHSLMADKPFDHHYIWEILCICLLTTIKSHLKIKNYSTIRTSLYKKYKEYILTIKN